MTVVHAVNASTIRRRVELSSVEFSRVELCRYKRALMLFITVTLINERCVVLYCVELQRIFSSYRSGRYDEVDDCLLFTVKA